MTSYFNAMQQIVDAKVTSSRVRFMLLDVIDLRRGKWVPRREDANPKTIDQIHKEAEAEEAKRNVQIQEAKQREREKQNQPNQQRRGDRATGKLPPPPQPQTQPPPLLTPCSSSLAWASFRPGFGAPSALFRSNQNPTSENSGSRRSSRRKKRPAGAKN
jgi:hypothetical protein